MKRHSYLRAIPAAAFVLTVTACGGSGNAQSTAATASPPAPSPSQTQTQSQSPGQVSAQDRGWLRDIHQVNLAEVEAGHLAEKKGATKAVRSVGQLLVTDHKQLDKKVIHTAKALGVSLPSVVQPGDAHNAERLGRETGTTFDQDFLATMIVGHRKAIAKTRTEIQKGSSAQVTGLARQALPTLKKHLRALQQAQSHG